MTSDDQSRTIEIVSSYLPKKAMKMLDLVCPVPGSEINLGKTEANISLLASMQSKFNVNQEQRQVINTSGKSKPVLSSMLSNKYQSESSHHSSRLHLINHGQNLCFSNSVVQLLSQTEIKSFLLAEITSQPNSTLETAQELARLYRNQGKVDSTEKLRR